jgi:hypothetical protein
MTDSDKSSHWNSLAAELGADATPRPSKPVVSPPRPTPKKRPAAPAASATPPSNWEDVAAMLGVDVPPRPPKPAPPPAARPKPPRVVSPVPEESGAGEIPPPVGEPTERQTSHHEGEPHHRSRRGDRHERGARREPPRQGRERRGRNERRGRRRGQARHERSEPDRLAEPPAEELLSDEMVSADFVDDLVSAEEEDAWSGKPAAEVRPSRADEEHRHGRRRRRRRGGQRGPDEVKKEARATPHEFDEEDLTAESEHIEEIVDAIEASPIAEPDDREPLEEAVAAQDMHERDDDKRHGKRRRRRRGRRRGPEAAGEATERDAGGEHDDLEQTNRLAGPHAGDAEPDFSATDEDEHSDGHDEDDVHEDGRDRPSHRAIPSWDEAIGVIVSANMEARAKNPLSSGPRGRGRGQHGRGRRS